MSVNSTGRCLTWAAAVLCASALGGCGLFPKPESGIAVRVAVDPPPKAQLRATDSGLIVDVDGFTVEQVPAGKPLTSVARLITGPVNEPMAGSIGSDRIVLISAEAPPALTPDVEPLQSMRLLIPSGWTGSFQLTGPTPTNPGLAVFISAPVPGGTPILRIGSHTAPEVDDAVLKAKPKPDQANTLTVEWPLAALPGAFEIGIQAGRVIGSPRSTIWHIAVSDASSDPSSQSHVRALVDDTIKSGARRGPSPWAGAARSLWTASPDAIRAVLTVAALGVNSDLCAETATLAESAAVSSLASAVADAWNALPPDADSTAASWAADRAAILWLGSLRTKGDLPKPLLSTLSARFGEAGRDPSTLADLATKSATSADFHQRLIAEHLILLDDLAPGTRVRAYDWLSAAGAAPLKFDPLAPAGERRAALEKYIDSLAKNTP